MVSELVYRAGMSLHRKSRSGLSIQFGRWERWECFCLSAFSFFFSFLLLRSSLISTMVRPTGTSTSHVPISELCWRVFTGRGHDDVMSIGFARCITRLLIRWKSTMPIQIWSWLNSVSVSGTAASPTHLRPPRAFPSSSLHLVRVPADIGTGAVVLKDFQLVVHFLFVVPWNFLSSFYGAAKWTCWAAGFSWTTPRKAVHQARTYPLIPIGWWPHQGCTVQCSRSFVFWIDTCDATAYIFHLSFLLSFFLLP